MPHIERHIYVIFLLVILLTGCRNRDMNTGFVSDTLNTIDSTSNRLLADTIFTEKVAKNSIALYGDTVWINPYGTQVWHDTLAGNDYSVIILVTVDTNDYIIDTVRSVKGNRIVIGYNHSYNLQFLRKNKPWFILSFDKKNDLRKTLRGTDYWLESNLDVFRNLVYNEKYNMFVVEFDINPRYNYGSVYYIVFDTKGYIQHIGASSNWGGGGPDGNSFLTENGEMYVSCFEIYNFSKLTSVPLTEYTVFSDVLRELEPSAIAYQQVHAIRDLKDNIFLVVYAPNNGIPDYNAVILSTDTMILDRFQYRGLMEEIDALFLFYPDAEHSRYFIHDTERNVLIFLETIDSLVVKHIPEAYMKELPQDTILSEAFQLVDFESFGSKLFYISASDTVVFYGESIME